MTFKWRNLFHVRTYLAPFLMVGLPLGFIMNKTGLSPNVAAFIFWPLVVLLVLVMLFGTPLECSNCGERVPHGRTKCKRCGQPVGTAATS